MQIKGFTIVDQFVIKPLNAQIYIIDFEGKRFGKDHDHTEWTEIEIEGEIKKIKKIEKFKECGCPCQRYGIWVV